MSQWNPEGPYAVAHQYVRAIEDGDFLQAFYFMRPELRRELAEAWVTANGKHPALRQRDLDAVVEALARPDTDEPLWEAFAGVTLDEIRANHTFLEDFDKWGWGSDPRPLGPDRELVILVRTEGRGGVIVTEDTELPGHGFVMQHGEIEREQALIEVEGERVENRWRVAEFLDPDDLLEASR
jgi:hypothetical protein